MNGGSEARLKLCTHRSATRNTERIHDPARKEMQKSRACPREMQAWNSARPLVGGSEQPYLARFILGVPL
jgi:hypothetical protein